MLRAVYCLRLGHVVELEVSRNAGKSHIPPPSRGVLGAKRLPEDVRENPLDVYNLGLINNMPCRRTLFATGAPSDPISPPMLLALTVLLDRVRC